MRFHPSYWDWSLDVGPTNYSSTAIFVTDVSTPTLGFGGNGPFVRVSPAQDPFNFTAMGRTGGGYVNDGPFTTPQFHANVNQAEPACLTRDFPPTVMNWFADPANMDKVLAQPDYTSFAFELVEGVTAFTQASIHGNGSFGLGSALGTIGDVCNGPGDPLSYLHHGNLDRVLWQWQQED